MPENNTESFYNEISSFYDDMIDFKKSLEKRKLQLQKFIKDDFKTAADLGCGSGLDSIALSSLGLNVTAFDPSDMMIRKARENARANMQEIDFICSGLEKIPLSYKQKFDIALLLGNTFANISPEKIERSIGKVYKILNSGGKFVLQILNYTRILRNEEKIVGINSKNDFTFVRYYDFHSDHLNFNILKFNSAYPDDRKVSFTKIFPYKKKFLINELKKSGFRKIKCFGSLSLDKFSSLSSKDLIILAEK